MTSFLKPSHWFRRSSVPAEDRQSGKDRVGDNTVINCRSDDDADGFTRVEKRPMTYAESTYVVHPPARAKIVCSEVYSPIDDAVLYVQMVDQYEALASAASKSPLSSHVLANIEYDADSFYEKRSRKRSSRSRRHSNR